MKLTQCLRFCTPLSMLPGLLLFAVNPATQADPVPVRYTGGSIHGFVDVRSEDGSVVASGSVTRLLRGDHITIRTIFHFKDGSTDDETTVYSQRRVFHLISDHHIQKGPSFPHPTDLLVNAATGQVTVRSQGKDGKEE